MNAFWIHDVTINFISSHQYPLSWLFFHSSCAILTGQPLIKLTFIITWLRYNLHTIKFIHIICISQWFSHICRAVQSWSFSILAHFYYPKRNFLSFSSHSIDAPNPQPQARMGLLFVFRNCLFWCFIQMQLYNVLYCDWLLSSSMNQYFISFYLNLF